MAIQRDSDSGLLGFLVGLLFGLIGGGIVGLLLAPRPGTETRRELEGFVKTLPNKVNNEISNPEAKTRRFLNKTKINLENQMDKMNEAIQAGKMAEAKRREEMASGYDYT
jgi:gas vesicle protein